MRFRYVGVFASVVVAVACARGEDVPRGTVMLIDADITIPPDDTGGSNGEPMGEGGARSTGGTVGTGNVGQGAGGSPPPAAGGSKPASGGKTGTGGMASVGGKTGMGGTSSGGTTGGGSGGKAAGGTNSGGAPSGGMTSNGGAAGSCSAGQKTCNGMCTPPAPRVGCGLTGCDACTDTAPANGYITCTANACTFDCLSGYTKMGTQCMGSGNGQGGAGSCSATRCPQNCSVVFGPACCTTDGKCGCPLIPYVAPTCVGS
jgi:hypothetical protein